MAYTVHASPADAGHSVTISVGGPAVFADATGANAGLQQQQVTLDGQSAATFWVLITGAGQADIRVALPYRLEAGTVYSQIDECPTQRLVMAESLDSVERDLRSYRSGRGASPPTPTAQAAGAGRPAPPPPTYRPQRATHRQKPTAGRAASRGRRWQANRPLRPEPDARSENPTAILAATPRMIAALAGSRQPGGGCATTAEPAEHRRASQLNLARPRDRWTLSALGGCAAA